MVDGTFIHHILKFIEANTKHTKDKDNNDTTVLINFKEPFIRPSLNYVYPLFIFLHILVGVVGIAGNAAMMIVIIKRRLYQDQTYFLIANLAFADLIKGMIVLPISLANLLIQNWLFGSFLCFFLPMMQKFPVHASMLTFLMIAIDRYRLVVHPFKSRLPAGLCIIAVWVAAVCVVLPYAIYIRYIDLESTLGEDFKGVGICFTSIERRIEEYIRVMFVTLYAMPLAVMALLYVRISAELKSRESASISIRYAQSNLTNVLEPDASTRSTSTLSWSPSPHSRGNSGSGPSSSCGQSQTSSGQCRQSLSPSMATGGTYSTTDTLSPSTPRSDCPDRHHHHHHHHHYHHSQNYQATNLLQRDGACSETSSTGRNSKTYTERSSQDSDDELDLAKEKRTQNYIITMTTLFAMCWCPLQFLVLVNFFVHEDDDNIGHYDITFILFAWFGFLSTCITPVLFASWRMSDATKDRLKGYFRFSNRRRASSGSQVTLARRA